MEMEKREETSEKKDMGNSIFAVINPVAGTSDCADISSRFEKALQESGLVHEIHEWQDGEDLTPIIDSARKNGYQRFVAIGGDGTFASVANRLVNKDIPVAFIPAGSTNSMARGLGIPLDLDKAIELAVTGTTIRVLDAMQVGDKYFFLNVGVGLSSKAIENTKREEKRKMAWLAYIISGVKQLSGRNLMRFKVEVDDRRIERNAIEVSVTNLGLMGIEPFRWGKDVQPDDGHIEVHIITTRTLIDYLLLGVNILLRRSEEATTMEIFPADKKIVIQAQHTLQVQADGEMIGETPIEVLLVPHSIPIIVPEGKDRIS